MRDPGSEGFDLEKKLGSCGVGAEHSDYCYCAVKGKRVIGVTPLPFFENKRKRATTSCRRFKSFNSILQVFVLDTSSRRGW
jgi:hypothetical protein